MRIGIISDTHGRVEWTRSALAVFEAEHVERVIHCGDIGSCSVIEHFTQWETHFVFGNVDHEQHAMRIAIESAGNVCHGRYAEVEWAGKRIAFLHGDDFRRLQERIASKQFDLVCSGHTHQRSLETIGATRVLNPGAIDRVGVASVAIVDLEELRIWHVDVAR